jgi:general stress protein 26
MPTPQELEAKFWRALKSDMTMMLGLDGVEDGHARPMTAQLDGERGPIWFFTSVENGIVEKLGQGDRAIATFTSKSHFRHCAWSRQPRSGSCDHRQAMESVAAWYEAGKDDPKLRLLRLDPERAEIWLDGSSLIAGIKMLLGVDPKESYKDHVAKVELR